jgi:uncharacterized membrane protein
MKRIGLVLVFLWFMLGGVAHFALTAVEMRIVPPSIPWPRAAVLVSGVFELLGAAGLLIPATRRAAGVGLFLLTIAVTPANVYMHAACRTVRRAAMGAGGSIAVPSDPPRAYFVEHVERGARSIATCARALTQEFERVDSGAAIS